MDKIDEVLCQLKIELDKNPVIQEYLSLKDKVESNPELKAMRLEIARLTNENKKEERDNLLDTYNNHPIMVNYVQAREEVVSLLNEMKNILSD